MTNLVDAFNTVQRSKPVSVPRGFDSPGTVDYTAGTGTVVTSEPVASEDYRALLEADTGLPVPEGLDVILDKATLQRGPEGSKTYWLKLKLVPKTLSAASFSSSIAALQAEIASVSAHEKKPHHNAGVIINVADLQIGKTDRHGGTPETVAAFYNAIAQAIAYVKRVQPKVIVLGELGDPVEGFENVKSQAQTNDLNFIEQINLHTELITYAAVELSKLAPKLIVVGVPSNHGEIRSNGKAVATVHNDVGLLSLGNVKRAMGLNTEAFSHVEFCFPAPYEVSVSIDVAGAVVGYAHGHNGSGNADHVAKWLSGQFAGNHPLQPATIINTAHFHHLKVTNLIGGRWHFQCPTLDRGSSWLENMNGQGGSQNGMIAYTIRDGMWEDFQLFRTN